MLWFSPSHRKDSESFLILGNKKSYIIAQALNSWVTIDLKKVTNLFEISLSIEKKSNLQNFSTKQVCKVKKFNSNVLCYEFTGIYVSEFSKSSSRY